MSYHFHDFLWAERKQALLCWRHRRKPELTEPVNLSNLIWSCAILGFSALRISSLSPPDFISGIAHKWRAMSIVFSEDKIIELILPVMQSWTCLSNVFGIHHNLHRISPRCTSSGSTTGFLGSIYMNLSRIGLAFGIGSLDSITSFPRVNLMGPRSNCINFGSTTSLPSPDSSGSDTFI